MGRVPFCPWWKRLKWDVSPFVPKVKMGRVPFCPGLARMRETVDAMGRSLTTLERTTAELRQDVTRLGDRWIGWNWGSTR